MDLVFLRGCMKSVFVRMASFICQWPAWAPRAKNTAVSASEALENAARPRYSQFCSIANKHLLKVEFSEF